MLKLFQFTGERMFRKALVFIRFSWDTGLSNSLELLRSKFARVKQDNVEMQTEIMYLQDQKNRIQGMNIPANLHVSTTFVDEKVQEDESNAVKIIKLNVSGDFKTKNLF